MLVTASAELVAFVRGAGGTVWVRCRPQYCGRGVVFLETTVKPPTSWTGYEPFLVEDILVAARLPVRPRPVELHLSMEGRRRPRPVAAWDGCAYII
jgi:hypothetical protein